MELQGCHAEIQTAHKEDIQSRAPGGLGENVLPLVAAGDMVCLGQDHSCGGEELLCTRASWWRLLGNSRAREGKRGRWSPGLPNLDAPPIVPQGQGQGERENGPGPS